MNEEDLKQHLINIEIHGATASTELGHAINVEYKKRFPNSNTQMSCGACAKEMFHTFYCYFFNENTPS